MKSSLPDPSYPRVLLFYFYKTFTNKQKKARPVRIRLFNKKGNDLLSHKLAVPSAQAGLTSLFGMGRGGHRRYSHLKTFNTLKVLMTYQ